MDLNSYTEMNEVVLIKQYFSLERTQDDIKWMIKKFVG